MDEVLGREGGINWEPDVGGASAPGKPSGSGRLNARTPSDRASAGSCGVKTPPTGYIADWEPDVGGASAPGKPSGFSRLNPRKPTPTGNSKPQAAEPYRAFLACATPRAWLEEALAQPDLLLVDHAHCEKKAASTALNLMFRYPAKPALQRAMSRLAREELRHFEQVLSIMERRGIAFDHLAPSRYAGGLRALVATHEPLRLVDTLICGAFIEARSCERFAVLAPLLDAELAAFYRRLLRSEARHFEDYLRLAQSYAAGIDVDARVEYFREREAELIVSEDAEFRFHSGVPQAR